MIFTQEADQLVWQIHYVMLSDALASSRPVRKAAETTPEIISLFDFIAYYKVQQRFWVGDKY